VNLTLRPYCPEDFETLYVIDQACYPSGIAYSRPTLRWFLALKESDCLIAEIENEIAGFILCEWKGQRAHIITIDVLERHRRSGVATALLREAEQRLAARGIRQVELETAQDNVAAIAFWQKHGYRTRGVYRRYYLGRIDALAMTKPLSRA
jgi:ribosomal-protein-alanine N-acetyltransferase